MNGITADTAHNLINADVLSGIIFGYVDKVMTEQVGTLLKEMAILKNSMTCKEVMTIEETAGYMGKTVSTVRSLIREKKITYYREGKRVYLKTSDINEFLLQNRYLSEAEINRAARTHVLRTGMTKMKNNLRSNK